MLCQVNRKRFQIYIDNAIETACVLKHAKAGNLIYDLKCTHWWNSSCYPPHKCRIGALSKNLFQELGHFRSQTITNVMFGESRWKLHHGSESFCVFIATCLLSVAPMQMQNTTKGMQIDHSERVVWLHKQLPALFTQRSAIQTK